MTLYYIRNLYREGALGKGGYRAMCCSGEMILFLLDGQIFQIYFNECVLFRTKCAIFEKKVHYSKNAVSTT